jgi:hypothetical protein
MYKGVGYYDAESDTYTTGSGQVIVALHDESVCHGRPCVIHNPSDHHMRDWPTHFREDRYLMERTCKHGVGHPDPDDVAWQESRADPEDAWAISVHGCCGCCADPSLPDIEAMR